MRKVAGSFPIRAEYVPFIEDSSPLVARTYGFGEGVPKLEV